MREILTTREINALTCYADCNMRAATAAPYLGVSRRTVIRMFNEIYRKTGYDPNEFWDLYKLINLLETEDVDGRKAGS